ncbi:hypothetical protein [Desulfocurvus sp.]|jgi:hypothetical protein|uniref:hypothetical protein n=1 Tax=Desulfocurvus sp. TaxID=2871698 RepID=UPI0025C09FB4|nr:hypothetical protein [Desulfocurvus sp.]MCK9240393.1 hypothetical protein [Desulfocurvus sp.]
MTILFVDDPAEETVLTVSCPVCKAPQQVRLAPGTSAGEICPQCNALFAVRLFPSGMAVVN